MSYIVIFGALVVAALVWWLAISREFNAAQLLLRNRQARERSKFARQQEEDAGKRPKRKAPKTSFGHR